MRATIHLAMIGLVLSVLPMLGIRGTSATATCAEIDPVTILPADDACPGWMRDGSPLTAYTLEELTHIIDGGAFLFGEYGFVAAAFQNYAGEIGGQSAALTLGLFNQGSAENAAALYDDPDSGWGDPLLDWGGSGAARVRSGLNSITLDFREACFFGSVTVGTGGDQATAEARCMALAVVVLIQGGTPVAATSWGSVKAGFR